MIPNIWSKPPIVLSAAPQIRCSLREVCKLLLAQSDGSQMCLGILTCGCGSDPLSRAVGTCFLFAAGPSLVLRSMSGLSDESSSVVQPVVRLESQTSGGQVRLLVC